VHDQLQGFELGAVDCVMKPFNISKLVLQVRNLVWYQFPNPANDREPRYAAQQRLEFSKKNVIHRPTRLIPEIIPESKNIVEYSNYNFCVSMIGSIAVPAVAI
jgi:hypothetical protein